MNHIVVSVTASIPRFPGLWDGKKEAGKGRPYSSHSYGKSGLVRGATLKEKKSVFYFSITVFEWQTVEMSGTLKNTRKMT